MRLLVQPADGVEPIVAGIRKAKKSVEIMIFRFDRREVRQALIEAVRRGVAVHALIAFTNRGGERKLRELETDFLANGITVGRTATGLKRYHGKMMVVDRKEVYVLGYNLTRLDIEHSRSFGLVTRNPKLLREAIRLFEADSKRQAYRPEHARFVVSPENARSVLARFLQGARKELLIYDPELSDPGMLRILRKRQEAGVKVRVVGKVQDGRVPARQLKPMRLHVRMIIRDRQQAFLGSQSLRREELESRREIGAIFRHGSAINTLVRTFKKDWAASLAGKKERQRTVVMAEAPEVVAKAVRKELPVQRVVARLAREIKPKANGKLPAKRIEKKVKKVLRSSVKQVVKEALEETVKPAA
ncbi:MAG TPA: phospholipase D-like domain-containing protein [Terriglobales bacterium]|nr:phospholipase D-like domain-containing protein [Terriglobales bacterium]